MDLIDMDKESLINIIKYNNKNRDETIENIKTKYKKKCQKQVKEIQRLHKYISKFREIEDKFGIKKGENIFVEYVSELGEVRTTFGLFILESKTHITIKVKDSKEYYYYHIKKKLINGIKEYYEKRLTNK